MTAKLRTVSRVLDVAADVDRRLAIRFVGKSAGHALIVRLQRVDDVVERQVRRGQRAGSTTTS